ncbi:MAG: 30S ribosomal protein S14 [Gammaproteobacteria bacterium CG_4_10_14_0_8_um_filter_38_16]|nr:MAG: 30S ribosomal protein S14 [Gammaproteobacteria bacterium CG_4_10_14_0_8_um_filter_38_16]PJA02906.1 MAG: 30S ribosomal protein S14 [Gammaproteobacteria bacterium CG_4_10_14_0_2_um_filter_38_22]PJB11427.1 MAG: 30S ribosomal protein S14 [Gammaproteobacteria bacterium CG_4_9_14_3_um_filter_38_9]
MAKTSVVLRNKNRKMLSERMKKTREALKETIRIDEEGRDEAVDKLQKRRRNECPVRVRNRCRQCGRSRGTLRRFGLCRIHLREAAMRGDVPGLRKASW